jgi:hypothetical protein
VQSLQFHEERGEIEGEGKKEEEEKREKEEEISGRESNLTKLSKGWESWSSEPLR